MRRKSLRQRVVFITENEKELDAVLKKYSITKGEFDQKAKEAWEALTSLCL